MRGGGTVLKRVGLRIICGNFNLVEDFSCTLMGGMLKKLVRFYEHTLICSSPYNTVFLG